MPTPVVSFAEFPPDHPLIAALRWDGKPTAEDLDALGALPRAQQERLKQIARIYDAIDDDELAEEAVRESKAALDRVVANSYLVKSYPVEHLDGLLERGEFLSLRETGTSEGANVPDTRNQLEDEYFGEGRPVPPHPQYGAFLHSDTNTDQKSGNLSKYGDLTFVLRPEVRERTSYTVGDTFTSDAIPNTDFAGDPERYASWKRRGGLGSFDNELEQFRRGREYIEAQIHGGVTLDDVAYVVIPVDHPDAQEIRRKLLAAAPTLEVVDGADTPEIRRRHGLGGDQ